MVSIGKSPINHVYVPLHFPFRVILQAQGPAAQFGVSKSLERMDQIDINR